MTNFNVPLWHHSSHSWEEMNTTCWTAHWEFLLESIITIIAVLDLKCIPESFISSLYDFTCYYFSCFQNVFLHNFLGVYDPFFAVYLHVVQEPPSSEDPKIISKKVWRGNIGLYLQVKKEPIKLKCWILEVGSSNLWLIVNPSNFFLHL